MLSLFTSMIPGMFKLGGKLIEDKDKRAEYAFKIQEMMQALAFKLLETKTYPWIDGLVKLAYASEAIVKGLFRPVGAAALTGAVIYCSMKGIDLPDAIDVTGAAAFPAWMGSRHVEKQKKVVRIEEEDDWI